MDTGALEPGIDFHKEKVSYLSKDLSEPQVPEKRPASQESPDEEYKLELRYVCSGMKGNECP